MLSTNLQRLLAAGFTTAAMAGLTASAAQADFTSPFVPKCSGASIDGRGASFQVSLQAAWKTGFENGYCAGTNYTNSNPNSRGSFDPVVVAANPPGVVPKKNVTYLSGGSGAGLKSFGANLADNSNPSHTRDANTRFAGTDDPPTATQLAEINAGPLPDVAGDEGAARTVPIASGSVVVVLNYPDNCAIPAAFQFKAPDGSPKYPAGTTRVKLTRSRTEFAFAGDAAFNTWGELVPGITGTNGRPDADCANQEVERVVRLDASGTTFSLKQWLGIQRPTRNWSENASPVVYTNTQWPNDSGATAVLRGAANGNGSLLDKVNATDGSIGYADLATARTKGFDKAWTDTDTTFWLPVQDQNNSYFEPTYSPESYKSGNPAFTAKKGANCRSTNYQNIPGTDGSATLASWAAVSGVGGTGSYPLCTLTYALVWDDTFDAFGAGANRIEEARQKTVKDYFLNYGLTNTGQNAGDAADYAAVPSTIRTTIAIPAVQAISYNKP